MVTTPALPATSATPAAAAARNEMRATRRSRRRGFSMVEMVMCLIIMSILAGIGWKVEGAVLPGSGSPSAAGIEHLRDTITSSNEDVNASIARLTAKTSGDDSQEWLDVADSLTRRQQAIGQAVEGVQIVDPSQEPQP